MQTAVSFFTNLVSSDNPITAILGAIVVILSGVVVYQWNYTTKKTVPKWIWDQTIPKFTEMLQVQRDMSTIIDQRLKK